MIKTQIGLGVLSIPAVLDTLGMGPGLVVLIVIGSITTWSNYVIGTFKKNHPSVYGIDDVGYKLFGKVGKEFFAVVFVLCKYCSVLVCILSIDMSQSGSSLQEPVCWEYQFRSTLYQPTELVLLSLSPLLPSSASVSEVSRPFMRSPGWPGLALPLF